MKVDSLDVQRWQKYIEQETGFVLPDIQLQWLANAIDCTAMSNGLSVQQLWYQLSKNDGLRQQLLDKVLIHESRFFRHRPSIDFVTKYALHLDDCFISSFYHCIKVIYQIPKRLFLLEEFSN